MNIFELASRQKLRFPSTKGDLTTEQLWDLPLTSRTGCDLDSVAKVVNQYLKGVSEESFVAVKVSPAKAGHELRLEIVKHIIAVKLASADDAKKRSENAAERELLTGILHEKNNEALKALTPEEIQARLSKLG